MTSIVTKFYGPTNTRGSRVVATATMKNARACGMTASYPYDHASNSVEAHKNAARLLVEKCKWSGEWVMGDNGPGSYVFVFVSSATERL